MQYYDTQHCQEMDSTLAIAIISKANSALTIPNKS